MPSYLGPRHRHLSLEIMDLRVQRGDDPEELLLEAMEIDGCQWCERDLRPFFEAFEWQAEVLADEVVMALGRALAPRRLEELLEYPAEQRAEVVEEDVGYQHAGLLELLLESSELALAAGNERLGRHLAELAEAVAEAMDEGTQEAEAPNPAEGDVN